MLSLGEHITRSRNWTCSHCQQTNLALLPDPPTPTSTSKEEVEPELIPTKEPVPSTNSSNPDFTASTMPPIVAENHEADPTYPSLTSTPDIRNSELLSHSAGQQGARITPIPSSHQQSDVNIEALHESVTKSETSTNQAPRRSAHIRSRSTRSQKPPVLLDTAICILLVLLFAVICRRMV